MFKYKKLVYEVWYTRDSFRYKVSRVESVWESDTKKSFIEGIRNNFFDTESSLFLCRSNGVSYFLKDTTSDDSDINFIMQGVSDKSNEIVFLLSFNNVLDKYLCCEVDDIGNIVVEFENTKGKVKQRVRLKVVLDSNNNIESIESESDKA